ncbi:MAG: VCBS repeat-containing protein [Desulfuromonadales bacterium]|nr:VCBS repeat-containing protein [Desulfuromonadales bacterium]
MKRLGQKICVAVALSLAFVAIWHDSAQAAMPVISSLGQIKNSSVVTPTRIDVDAAGTIYLCDGTLNGVARFDKYGKALQVLRGGYKVRSNGVAVTPDGSRVFVSVSEPNSAVATAVAVINGSTGELIGYLGGGFGEFKGIREIDLDAAGNIYVGNYDKGKTVATVAANFDTTAQIDVYDGVTYAKTHSFGAPASNLVNGYYLPLAGEFGEIGGLTVDVVNQEVIIAEGWNNNGITRAQVFSLDGTLKRLLTEAEVSGTQINCKPVGLTVDPTGRVYMLSILTSTIHAFTINPVVQYLGKFTSGTPDPAYDPITGKVYPWTVGMIPSPAFDVVYDSLTNRIFVVTDGNGIQIFSVDGSTNPVKTNNAPEAPALISPVQDVVVATLTPTLQWSAAVDADNDVLSYNVQIMALDGTIVSSNSNIAATSHPVAAGKLVENSWYTWQVQAADAELTSPYSAVGSFWVNAVEEAPTAALLLSPDNATRADKDTIFSWQAATDADPLSSISYRLEIARNADFTAPIIRIEQSGLSSAPLSTLPGYDDLQSGTTYDWRVVAVDNSASRLISTSAVRSFFSNSAPEIPVMLSPLQGDEVATLTPDLQWAAPVDADGDTLRYNVRIVDAAGVVVSTNNSVATTNFMVTGGVLLENNQYGWQVQADDGKLTSDFSEIKYFWVNAVEEAPTAPALDAPAAVINADKDTTFHWQAASDPDPLAFISYRLEIARDSDFATPVIVVEQAELFSAVLSEMAGYDDLQANTTYQWRVLAIDNTGLSTASEVRALTYVSTILTIDATFPGAKVYLGGNSAYSGRYVGEVPVALRDIDPGTIEVVVELAGFEPWIKSVVVNQWQGVVVTADLVVAILPGEFKKASLFAGGVKIQGGPEAAPVLVDFDSDGIDDLLVADGSGKLLLYKGLAGDVWSLAAAVQLPGVTLPVGAVPFVADWNNDNRKDLLVGAADGSVSLALNVGTQESPVFAALISLQADNAPLSVGSNAAPLLFDLDADGAKDLLVGSGDGTLYSFRNIGSDATPVFAAREVLIAAAAGASNASALVSDWDADGSKEILLAANQEIALYERQDDAYVKGDPLLVHQSLYNTRLRSYEMQSSSFGEKIRMIAANPDGKFGKDLLIGNAAGEILLANSTMNKSRAISPHFDLALMATVAEIEALIQENSLNTPLLTLTLSQLKTNIQSQAVNKLKSYDKAKQNVLSMQSALQENTEISAVISKLQTQLNSKIPLK